MTTLIKPIILRRL